MICGHAPLRLNTQVGQLSDKIIEIYGPYPKEGTSPRMLSLVLDEVHSVLGQRNKHLCSSMVDL